MRFAGELAALGTAVCWAAGSNFFATAARSMSSQVLNRLRIGVAMVLLSLALLVTRGSPWPTWASPEQVGLLAASGLVGFVFGDSFYFRALVILGPGRASLLASLAPLFTVIVAWPLLGEHPGRLALLGMGLTLAGITIVLMDRERREHAHVEGSVAIGVLCGVLGALGQAVGYVISKLALQTGLDALSATVVRIVAAAVAIWAIAAFQRGVGETLAALRDRKAAGFMVAGAIAGPFVGVTLSLAALNYIEAGVAASITACYPILALAIATRMHGERFTWRAVGGAVIAVAGVVVLFYR